LPESLEIAKTCKLCAEESPGLMHAHTLLHFKYVGKAQQEPQKQQQNTKKLQKSASFNPSGLREIMQIGR
jgi:membrane protein insertase Oxa1/YidC/SpoIIIJ